MLKTTGQYMSALMDASSCQASRDVSGQGPGAYDGTRPWKKRRAAVGALALLVGLAGCGGGGDDDPEPAPAPVAAPAPGPAPAPAPAPGDPIPAGFAKSGEVLAADALDVGDRYTKGGREVVYDAIGKKYYEFVATPGTWDAAKAAAVAAGGYLAVLSTPLEMLFVNQAYEQLGGPDGVDGTWVGASQISGATAPGEGWTWLDGSALAADSELWNDEFGGLPLDSGLPENGQAQYGAVYNGKSSSDTKLLYDSGTATDALPKFLIEYDSAAAVK